MLSFIYLFYWFLLGLSAVYIKLPTSWGLRQCLCYWYSHGGPLLAACCLMVQRVWLLDQVSMVKMMYSVAKKLICSVLLTHLVLLISIFVELLEMVTTKCSIWWCILEAAKWTIAVGAQSSILAIMFSWKSLLRIIIGVCAFSFPMHHDGA